MNTEKTVYRVIRWTGRKQTTIHETKPFDGKDFDADYTEYRNARKEYNDYTMKLWTAGYFVTGEGIIYAVEGAMPTGRVEIVRETAAV